MGKIWWGYHAAFPEHRHGLLFRFLCENGEDFALVACEGSFDVALCGGTNPEAVKMRSKLPGIYYMFSNRCCFLSSSQTKV